MSARRFGLVLLDIMLLGAILGAAIPPMPSSRDDHYSWEGSVPLIAAFNLARELTLRARYKTSSRETILNYLATTTVFVCTSIVIHLRVEDASRIPSREAMRKLYSIPSERLSGNKRIV